MLRVLSSTAMIMRHYSGFLTGMEAEKWQFLAISTTRIFLSKVYKMEKMYRSGCDSLS